MDLGRLNDWIQVVTGVGILLGLGLVVWELRQNQEATMSQLSSDGFQIVSQFQTSVFGEQPAEALAKACDQPEELTTAELVVLDHYFTQIMNRALRVKTLADRGSFYSDDWWMDADMGGWNLLFETPAGRAWWRAFPQDPELKAVGDRLLSKWNGSNCVDLFNAWMSIIPEEANRRG